jgi:hypothetical protein
MKNSGQLQPAPNFSASADTENTRRFIMFRRTSIALVVILTALVGPLAALTPGTDVLVPAVALAGDWRTDLYLFNHGTETANVTVYLLVRDQANPAPESQSFVIPAGEAAALENVLADTFGLTSFAGAFRVTSDYKVVVNSRIYNFKEGVSFGQGFEGIPRCMAVLEGDSTHIVGLAKNANFRTNLVMIDATGDTDASAPSQVRVTLSDAQGNQVASKEIALDGFEPFLKRIDSGDVFGAGLADFDYGTLHCEVLSGAVIFAASKVDNDSATGDPTTLAAWSPGCDEPEPEPTSDVYLYSAAGEDDLEDVSIEEWSSGSTLTELTDDPDYGRVMMVEPGNLWGAPSSCIAFANIGDFQANFDGIVFKMKSDDLSAINVKVPEVELTYDFADGVDLGNGWYEITAPLSDFVGAAAGSTQFGILGGYGLGGTFFITDVKLTVEQ